MSKETSRQTYDNRYIIDAVIRDKEGRTTHVEIRGHIYKVEDVIEWINNSTYEIFTRKKESNQEGNFELVPVKVIQEHGRSWLRSAADKSTSNNLDYLGLATL